jgi:hypothetical protein
MSSPPRNRSPDGSFQELQRQEFEHPILSQEAIFHQIYDFVVEDRADELQQFIYDHEVDISKVLWKVCDCDPLWLISFRID